MIERFHIVDLILSGRFQRQGGTLQLELKRRTSGQLQVMQPQSRSIHSIPPYLILCVRSGELLRVRASETMAPALPEHSQGIHAPTQRESMEMSWPRRGSSGMPLEPVHTFGRLERVRLRWGNLSRPHQLLRVHPMPAWTLLCQRGEARMCSPLLPTGNRPERVHAVRFEARQNGRVQLMRGEQAATILRPCEALHAEPTPAEQLCGMQPVQAALFGGRITPTGLLPELQGRLGLKPDRHAVHHLL